MSHTDVFPYTVFKPEEVRPSKNSDVQVSNFPVPVHQNSAVSFIALHKHNDCGFNQITIFFINVHYHYYITIHQHHDHYTIHYTTNVVNKYPEYIHF